MASLYSKSAGPNGWGTITSWNTAANGSGSDKIPDNTDACIIQTGHTITLDTATAVCDSLAATSGTGTLVVDGTLDTKLIVDKGINFTSTTSYLNIDMSAAPTKKCEIYLNNDASATGGTTTSALINGKINLKGYEKKTWTLTQSAMTGQSATTVDVDNALGWRVGDKLVFATTQAMPSLSIATTAVSWAANVLTVTNSGSNAGLVVGSQVFFSGLTATNSPTTMLNVNMVVTEVTSTTSFKCAFTTNPGVITDQVGTALLMPKTDAVTIATISPTDGSGSGTAATTTITWTDGVGAGGAVAYDHADNCLVANFTRNLIFGPATARNVTSLTLLTNANGGNGVINDVEFRSIAPSSSFGYAGNLVIWQTNSATAGINRCSFWDFSSDAINFPSTVADIPRSDNVYYSVTGSASVNGMSVVQGAVGDETNMVVLRAAEGPKLNGPGHTLTSPMISGLTSTSTNDIGAIDVACFGDAKVIGGGVWSCRGVAASTQQTGGRATFLGTWLGQGFDGATYTGAGNDYIFRIGGATNVTFDSCPESTTGGLGVLTGSSSTPSVELRFLNRNNNAATQEIYKPKSSTSAACFARDISASTEIKNANASMRIDTFGTQTLSQEFEILVKGGEAATIHVWVKKNAAYNDAAYTLPSATLSGLGITPIAVSGTNVDDTWELLDLSYASGAAPSADGVLTLTLSAQSATATGKCYFSGIPIPPFVTRVRHYGYVVAETSPTLTADPAIDPAISQATAAAYANITITWGATSSISTGADQTFKKLVHYTAATMISNVASALPITWAGAYNAPAIFAQGAIDISADTLDGGGSLDMGAYTLTVTTPFAFTYTGGAYSRATGANPAFSAGALTLPTAITTGGAFSLTDATIKFGAASALWDLSDVVFSGVITIETTAGQTVTVAMPTPSGFTIDNNEPGNITVTTPVVTADISITSMPNDAAGTTRLQIINSTALSASAWAAGQVYATGALVKRSTGIGSESTAGLYFRATTGGTSHATTEPTWDTTVGNTTADNTVVWTCYKILYYDADPAATSLTDTYIDGEEFLAGETAEIRFAEMNGATSFKTYSTEVSITAAGFSALVAEEADAVFATFAIDGSTLEATFSPNFTSDYIVLDSNTDFAGKGAFAYYCYTLTTSAGMYNFWGGVTALDAGNIRINVSVLNLYFDESAGFVKQTDNVRIFRSDDARPAIDPTTGGHGIEINWRTPVSTTVSGSGVTSQDKTDIIDGVWSRVLPL